MLSVLADLSFAGISIISVADGLDSGDEESKLGIQIRGIFNELQLQDLKKKALRGQIGQKKRGFSAGENVFGYKSVPYGETVIDKKCNPRPEGYKFEIDPRESEIVQRIFEEFGNGISISNIVRSLNLEGIPGKRNSTKKWANSTVSRLLENEKYIGKWVWNKTESRRDPKTGRRRRFTKPESEWITTIDESLRIIPQSSWELVQKRKKSMKNSWLGGKGQRGLEGKKGSLEDQYPSHLLSGILTCASCGTAISQVSGKGGGYFGCRGARRGTCPNKIIIRRKIVEKVILDEIRDRISSPEKIQQVLLKVQSEIEKHSSDIPSLIRRKEMELNSEERKLANFIDFIGEGRGSRALSKALEETERKVDTLQHDLEGLHLTRKRLFQTPPIEWISVRINNLKILLEQNTTQSALVLREILGPVTFEPTYPDIGKPYYIARSSLNTLVIINQPACVKNEDNGSHQLRWWARSQRIRTFAELPFSARIFDSTR